MRRFLAKADPQYATVKAKEFEKLSFRIFALMPGYRKTAKLPPAIKRAQELDFRTAILAETLSIVEALHAGRYIAAITRAIERIGQPIEPPCVLFSSGEMIVTVGKETGESKVILFNHSGHGLLDLSAYESFLSGKLMDYDLPEEEVKKSLAQLPKVPSA